LENGYIIAQDVTRIFTNLLNALYVEIHYEKN